MQITGDGIAKNPEAARETLSKLCYDDNQPTSCYGIGLLAELGVGGSAQNSDKAIEQYVKFPTIRDASLRAVRLVESGKAKPEDKVVASIYARACTHVGSNDVATCKKAGALAEPSDKHGASIYYRLACRYEDKEACEKADALEPSLPPKRVGDGRAAPLKPIEKKPAPPAKLEKAEKPEKADAPPTEPPQCKTDKDCARGHACMDGACALVKRPAPPPPNKDKSSDKKD
jgi:hypothetical protein